MERRLIFLLVSSAIFSAFSAAHRDNYVKHRHGNKEHQNKVLEKLAYTLMKLIDEKNHQNAYYDDNYHSIPVKRYKSLDDGFNNFLSSLNPFHIHKNKNNIKDINRRSGTVTNKAVDEFTSQSIDDFLLKTTRRKAENPTYGVKDFVNDVLEELLPGLRKHGNNDSDETILEILVERSGGADKRKNVFGISIPNIWINNEDNYEDLSVIPLLVKRYNKYHHTYDGYGIKDINSDELSLAKDALLIDTKYGKSWHESNFINSRNKNSISNKDFSKPPLRFLSHKFKWEPNIKTDTSEIRTEAKLLNTKLNSGSYDESYLNTDTSYWGDFNKINSYGKKHKSNKDFSKYTYFKADPNNNSNKKPLNENLQKKYNYYNPYNKYKGNYDLFYPESKQKLPENINPANVDILNSNNSNSYVSKDRILEILDNYKKLLLDQKISNDTKNIKLEKKKQKTVLPIGHFDQKYLMKHIFDPKSYKNELAKNKFSGKENVYNHNYGKHYYENDKKDIAIGKKRQKNHFFLPIGHFDQTYLLKQIFDPKSHKGSDKPISKYDSEKNYKNGDNSGKYDYLNGLAKNKFSGKENYDDNNYGKHIYDSDIKYIKLEKKKQKNKFVLPIGHFDQTYLIKQIFDPKSYKASDKLKSEYSLEKYYKYGDNSGKYYTLNELAKNAVKENYYNDNYGKYSYDKQFAKKELPSNDRKFRDKTKKYYFDKESYSDKKYLAGKALGNYNDSYFSEHYESGKSLEVSHSAYKGNGTKGLYDDKYRKPNNYLNARPEYEKIKLKSLEKNMTVDELKKIYNDYPFRADKYKSIAVNEPGKVLDGYKVLDNNNKKQNNTLRADDTQPHRLHKNYALHSEEVYVGKTEYKGNVKNPYKENLSGLKEKTITKAKNKKCKVSPILEGVMFAFRYKLANKYTSLSMKSDTLGKPDIAVEVKPTTGVEEKKAVGKAQYYQPNTRRYGYTRTDDDPNTYVEYVDETSYAPYARTFGWT